MRSCKQSIQAPLPAVRMRFLGRWASAGVVASLQYPSCLWAMPWDPKLGSGLPAVQWLSDMVVPGELLLARLRLTWRAAGFGGLRLPRLNACSSSPGSCMRER